MPLQEMQSRTGVQPRIWVLEAEGADRTRLANVIQRICERDIDPGGLSILVVGDGDDQQVRAGQASLPLPRGMVLVPATHGSRIEPGHVYLLPSGRLLVAKGGALHLSPRNSLPSPSPFAHLATSLAPLHGDNLHILRLCDSCDGIGPEIDALGTFGCHVHALDLLLQKPADRRVPTASLPHSDPLRHPPRSSAANGQVCSSHQLRQPLQSLTLLQSLLARRVTEPRTCELVHRLGETVQQLVTMLTQSSAPNRLPEPEATGPLPVPSMLRNDAAAVDDTVSMVFVIDDDHAIRIGMRDVLEAEGFVVRDFESCEAFLDIHSRHAQGCLLVDAYLPGMSGLELLQHLARHGPSLPAIMITGSSDVPMAVKAMKTGARDFIEKPVAADDLVAVVRRALALARDSEEEMARRERAGQSLKILTRRQKQIMAMVLEGHPSKNIAADLGISQRTVENHRAAIMRKTGSRSLPALARLALSAPAGNF